MFKIKIKIKSTKNTNHSLNIFEIVVWKLIIAKQYPSYNSWLASKL